MSDVTILLGSKNDISVGEKALEVLRKFDVEAEIVVASAHRAPERVKEIVSKSDAKVFIAIAGLSAALPGAVAALTTRPVIGVPVSGKVNLDSILSIVQMPPGVPVAAVGLDRGDNAALLALEILALSDSRIHGKLLEYRKEMAKQIERDSEEVQR
ncbi:MAG: 5-(carboxyamino)imidazole ribonucleotide mutase [Methanomassiliicoccales archaeon]|jgi:5-(carboxyamino)imidazole ribonucleotide mutase|nr:5-(carboxyamino)imidazole ribonucleotide mutase [Methanomassiliicoccales archaeon]